MISAGYIPDAGDLIWTDFDPRVGREQSGRRPAIVLSPATLFRYSGFVIVCSITSTIRNYGSNVLLPPGLPVSGEILTSHVRSIDTGARPMAYAGAAIQPETLAEVRSRLAVLCGIYENMKN